jgi:hypothetical protein
LVRSQKIRFTSSKKQTRIIALVVRTRTYNARSLNWAIDRAVAPGCCGPMYDWPTARTQFVNAARSAAICRRVNQDALILGGPLFQIPPAWVFTTVL